MNIASTKSLNINFRIHKININTIFTCLLFVFSPLLALPFIFVEIYNNKRYAFSLLSLFMVFVAWLFPPIMDLYRHYLQFLDINGDPASLNNIVEDKLDFILYYVNKFYGWLGLPFEFVRATFVFISYEILFWIYRDLIKKFPNSKKNNFVIFIIWLLASPLLGLTIGIRQAAASCFFILGLYLINFKNKLGYFWWILACATHYSFILYIIPYIFFFIYRFKISNKKIFFISLLILIFINPLLFEKIASLPFIPLQIRGAIMAYLFGEWSQNRLGDRNFNYLILYIISYLPTWLLILNSFIAYSKNQFVNITKYSLIFLLFYFQISHIVGGRFTGIFDYIALFAFFVNFNSYKKYWKLFLISTFLITQWGQFYSFRREIKLSYENRIIMPIPVILMTTYSSQWVFTHIDDEGFTR